MDKNESDEALLERYRAGDEAALSRLIERHLPGVHSLIVRLAGAADAEDLTQDVFLRVWRNLGRFRAEQSRFKTWLYAIARNAAIDALRRRTPLSFSRFETEDGENPLFESLTDREPLPDEVAIAAEEQGLVEEALSRLSAAYRETIALYYGSSLTFEEIGRMLGLSVNTVKSRHRRALRELRTQMHQKGGGERI